MVSPMFGAVRESCSEYKIRICSLLVISSLFFPSPSCVFYLSAIRPSHVSGKTPSDAFPQTSYSSSCPSPMYMYPPPLDQNHPPTPSNPLPSLTALTIPPSTAPRLPAYSTLTPPPPPLSKTQIPACNSLNLSTMPLSRAVPSPFAILFAAERIWGGG